MTYEEKIKAKAKEKAKPFPQFYNLAVEFAFREGADFVRENPPPEFVLKSDVEEMLSKLRWVYAQDKLQNMKNIVMTAIQEFEQKYDKEGAK